MGVIVDYRSFGVSLIGVLNPVIVDISHKAVLLEVVGHNLVVIAI